VTCYFTQRACVFYNGHYSYSAQDWEDECCFSRMTKLIAYTHVVTGKNKRMVRISKLYLKMINDPAFQWIGEE
jgi:hypothetical protein